MKKIKEEGATTESVSEQRTTGRYAMKDENEKRLQQEHDVKAVLATILYSIPHAVIVLKERHIIFANPAVEAVFGWKPEELIGKTTRVLYRSDEEYE
ncbi:MAG: PAS domain S-box protein, partial [Deltaproteobacteria bacterium]|nr:PAS domain S-box protein [Deltaproteobacteria bacterium]